LSVWRYPSGELPCLPCCDIPYVHTVFRVPKGLTHYDEFALKLYYRREHNREKKLWWLFIIMYLLYLQFLKFSSMLGMFNLILDYYRPSRQCLNVL
jgi:hypothetical protein